MNWVGGARSRVCFHGDLKTQKEYFERKKFGLKVTRRLKASRTNRKNTISQDLKAIQTVDKIHDDRVSLVEVKRPVKVIDIDKCSKSFGRRKIENIDLGPTSPVKANENPRTVSGIHQQMSSSYRITADMLFPDTNMEKNKKIAKHCPAVVGDMPGCNKYNIHK